MFSFELIVDDVQNIVLCVNNVELKRKSCWFV